MKSQNRFSPQQIFTTSTLEEESYLSNKEKIKKGSIIGDYLKVLPTRNSRAIHESNNDCNNNSESQTSPNDRLLTIPDTKSEASSDYGYASRKAIDENDNDQFSIMTPDDRYESNYSSNISDRNNLSDESNSLEGKESSEFDCFSGIEDYSGSAESWCNFRIYNLIFIGDMSVGKSALIYKLVKNKFLNNLCSTVGVDFHMKTLSVDGNPINVQLWDTGGQERYERAFNLFYPSFTQLFCHRFRSITVSYFRKADGVLIMYDVTNQRSFINVRSWMAHLSVSQYAQRGSVTLGLFRQTVPRWIKSLSPQEYTEEIPAVLVGNKTDLRTESGSAVSKENGDKLAKVRTFATVRHANG